MKLKQYLIIALITSFCAGWAEKSKINKIKVTDHGIIPNTKQSITSKINKRTKNLNDEQVTIVFPNGRYDFYPDSSYFKSYFETNTYDVNPKRLAILLEGKKNITVDTQVSDFIYHGHISLLH